MTASIYLNSVTVKTERRIRLYFDSVLAAGAFTNLNYYTITCPDNSSSDPSVVAAFVVTGSPGCVELALGSDLTPGTSYAAAAVGVPSVFGGNTSSGTSANFVLGPVLAPPILDTPIDDVLGNFFGDDLVWDGQDLVETASGDLATIGGEDNAVVSLGRRFQSEGLPWDDGYGTKPRRFVDGARASVSQLRGAILRQALLDDRVETVSATLAEVDPHDPSVAIFNIEVGLTGGSIKQLSTPIKVA